ncbi:MAG: rRNA maturation RNase YbeY [Chlamydiota bacterium]
MEKIKKSLAYPKRPLINKPSLRDAENKDQVNVACYCKQADLTICSSQVKNLVNVVLTYKQIVCDTVICHFVDTATISALHRDFFNDPTPTDCISFPLDAPTASPPGDSILGEIFVCPRIAIDYATTHQLNPYDEVSLYLIHGLLHLIGYTDTEPKKRAEMRRQEKACLCYLEEKKALLTP